MAKPIEKPADEMTVEEAREILGTFLDEYSKTFEPSIQELEAMRTLVRAT